MTTNDVDQSPGLSMPSDSNRDQSAQVHPANLFPIVGVGASAGGLDAFTQLLKALPADTGMAFVLVQHLAPTHTSALAEILSRATTMPVTEVRDELKVEPNCVYVIPPGQSMVIAQGALQLLPRAAQKIHRPVDQFFRALGEDRKHQAIGVVLSGTASDGTLGLEAIKAEGGITFAQDVTAQHEGMPHSAIASGCVDFILPPDAIAAEIVRIGQHPYAVPKAVAGEADDKPSLIDVIRVLRDVTGVDFTHYKFNTLYRRVARRMVFLKMNGLAEYARHLAETPVEVEALYQDILINVTSFFRDPESFEALKATVFPRLLQDRSRHDPVRLWTLGCSTGQEAYSLAMAFTEAAEAVGSSVPFQLFATDLNPAGIEKARAGLYPHVIDQDVSSERLHRFFTKVDGNYRISKTIRDACVFSRHNVLADPPFSRIDLISCRNLLIYLEPVLQQRIVPTLHFALQPAGFLWLGGSETIGAYRNLFEEKDVKHKIYGKKPGTGTEHGHLPFQKVTTARSPFHSIPVRPNDVADLPREADRVLLSKFAPPSVLVSGDLDILQYRGDTGPYLAPAPGKVSTSLLKMLREGLLVGVRAAVLRAGKENTPVREDGLRVKSNDGYRDVSVEVVPVKVPGANAVGFLVMFEESPANAAQERRRPSRSEHAADDAHADHTRLEQELAATREYLQSVIEQQEVINEELQSANEEVQSANEELQSTNEELETSKEEIQSSNEELATVNDELNSRLTELNRVNNDLVNLIGSVQMAIVMLGPDLRVRRYTPLAETLLNLIPTDVGRPLADINLNLDNLTDIDQHLAAVRDTAVPREDDVRDKRGNWYSLRLHPYRTLDNKIDGVVVMLVDIDQIKRAQAYAESIVATVHEPLLVLDGELRVRTASRAYYEIFGVLPTDIEGRNLYEIDQCRWDIPELHRLLDQVVSGGEPFDDFEVETESETSGRRWMLLNARRLLQVEGAVPSILLAIEDVTARNRADAALIESHARFESLFNSSPVNMYLVDAELRIRLVSPTARPVFGDIGELIGRDFVEVIHILWHPDYADEIVRCFLHTLETGEPFQTSERIEQRLDRGVIEYYEWQIHRLVLSDGQFGVVCYFTDISARVLAQQSLQENDQRLKFVMDSMPQKIFTTTPDGEINYFNRQWSEFTGMSFKELMDSGWTRHVHPDDVDEKTKLWHQAFETGEPFQSEHRFRQADGQYRWHFGRAVPMRDETGQIVMWVGSNTDVHDIKLSELAVQTSETRYRRLFEASKDGVLLLDAASQKITHVNPFLADLLDYPPEEFIGRELWEIGFMRDKEASQAAMQKLEERGSIRYESLPLEDRVGNLHPVEMVANIYKEGDHQVIQCNIRDISERSLLEKLLRGQAAELSDLHRRKDEFLAMLSHELRSPLAPIASAVQLLSLQSGTENEIQLKARNIIERQLGQLRHLVDDLLEVSRITSGRVQLRRERSAVSDIVAGAVETVRPLIEQRRHELTVSLPPEPIWLYADASRLEQVLVNLLTNAAKYTEPTGHVWLTVQREGDDCVVRVRDTGVGIAPALLPHIFDLFTQAERSLDRSQGGLGIGLALVRRLTELHGGHVNVFSVIGRGSEFVVYLPIMPPDTLQLVLADTEVAGTTTTRQMRVLVVDDNADTALGYSILLRAMGHHVQTACDGPAGVQATLDFRPDIVLLDIGLPGLNGYDVARRIRQEPTLQNVVLVALTGYGQDADRQTSQQAGFNHHLVKPADFVKLKNILATVSEQVT